MSANVLSSKIMKSCFLLKACRLSINVKSKSSSMSTWVFSRIGPLDLEYPTVMGSFYLDEADIWPYGVDDCEEIS